MKDILTSKLADFLQAFPSASVSTTYLSNATAAYRQDGGPFKIIYYFLDGECCGLAMQKNGRSLILPQEVQSALYRAALHGLWKATSPALPDKTMPATIDYEFTPGLNGGDKALAQQQGAVGQLIIWSPAWIPLLEKFSSSPI